MNNYSILTAFGLNENQIKRVESLSENGETIFLLNYLLINELAQSVNAHNAK